MTTFHNLCVKLTVLFYCAYPIHSFVFDHRPKIVIDHDGGADDAMAIFIALLREKYFDGPELIGITTVNGNVNESQSFINSQRVLDVADRLDVPIYRGSPHALVLGMPTDQFFGDDGLGDNEETPYRAVMAQHLHSALALIELSKRYEGKVIVVAIGPLTNIALATRLDPNFINRLLHMYIGAGHIYSEAHPKPEFNAELDVESFHVVAENANPKKVTVVPFSQIKDSMLIPKEWRLCKLGSIKTEIMKAQNSFETVSLSKSKGLWQLLDPAVMSLVLDQDIIAGTAFSNQSIILCGKERGIVTNDFSSDNANVKVVKATSMSKYQKFLIDTFSAELK